MGKKRKNKRTKYRTQPAGWENAKHYKPKQPKKQEAKRETGIDRNLILTTEAHETIKYYTQKCPWEIGMFGYVSETPGGFLVDEVFLVKQEVTGGSVDFTDEGLTYAIERASQDNRLSDLRFCCHSHVNMGAFWSGTDEGMIEGFNNGMTEYLVSMVTNKKGESLARVDYYNMSGAISRMTNQVRYDLEIKAEPTKRADLDADYEELVTQERPTTKWQHWQHTPHKGRKDTWFDKPSRVTRSKPRPTHQLELDDEMMGGAVFPVMNEAGDITGWMDADGGTLTEDQAELRDMMEETPKGKVLGNE